MDYFSLVLHPGDTLHGWGRIRVDADGTWFEPDHAIPLVLLGPGREHPRWPHAVRLYGHDPAMVATMFGDDGSIPAWATIVGTWQGDSILATTTSPLPWRTWSIQSNPPHDKRSPRDSPEIAAAVSSLTPHKYDGTYAFSSQWMDPQGQPHFSIGVCRVTPDMAAWATAHPAVMIHFEASLLPVGTDPAAAAGNGSNSIE